MNDGGCLIKFIFLPLALSSVVKSPGYEVVKSWQVCDETVTMLQLTAMQLLQTR